MRRVLALLVAAAALASLTGCRISGHIDVQPDASVKVALEGKSGPSDLGTPCFSRPPLESSETVDPSGEVTCHVTGTIPADDHSLGLMMGRVGDALSLGGIWPGWDPGSAVVQDLDITVSFPGRVLAVQGGTMEGSTAHFRDPARLLSPTSEPWVGGSLTPTIDRDAVAGLIGFVAGGSLAGGVGVRALLKRRRAEPGTGPEPEQVVEVIPDAPVAPASPPQDPSVWAPDADS